ncbi:MAG: glycogen-binding domain-containing protein [Proteobacteria bacterium]|nr:glycogen-binding domain-containing protein [Pseudomonadota bacterium]MBU1139740.1 glycogen-binding domain-containing protein [Pseudomonadota bacterium]
MDHLISMYIDNELSLDEKIDFLEHVYGNKPYKEDAVELLEQEKLLSASLKMTAPVIELKTPHASILPLFNRSLGWAVAACLLILFSFMGREDVTLQAQKELTAQPSTVLHRFVIHRQNTQLVEITGSFTNWQSVPLLPSGTNGYWEISLEVPAGEHRYTFIVDGSKFLPDPTVVTQESDDFGSTNSILKVEA